MSAGPIPLGVVSNTWSRSPGSLLEQIRRAQDAGFTCIELRQGSLPGFEQADDMSPPLPDPDALTSLANSFPGVRMNLAVEGAFLSGDVDPMSDYWRRCLEGALALGGDDPTLRVVDVHPCRTLLDHEETTDELGARLAGLIERAAAAGVRMAFENSHQPLSVLVAVLDRADFSLSRTTPLPKICWDPHNQIRQPWTEENPLESARETPVGRWFMVHFKQGSREELRGDVGPGPIDWPALLSELLLRGYSAPGLFELPPGPDAWSRLERSLTYIRDVIASATGDEERAS